VKEPTAEEQLVYFVTLVGLERLEDALALMSAEEVYAVRKAAAKPLLPSRVDVVRNAVTRKVHTITQTVHQRSFRELRDRNGWIV
jgi:DNA-binding GntR family transcriptional regulator